MRILPAMLTTKNFVNTAKYNAVNQNGGLNSLPQRELNHQYTGIPSVDLAYASMFDNEIARDLKIMGLI